MKNKFNFWAIASMFILVSLVSFTACLERYEAVPAIGEHEITLKQEGHEVVIQLGESSINEFDESSFKLILLNNEDLFSEENHTHDAVQPDKSFIAELQRKLPDFEVIRSTFDSDEEYAIELTGISIPAPTLATRGCNWYSGACVSHGGCWRSRYKCSCGGYHYSTCNFTSPWHYHSY